MNRYQQQLAEAVQAVQIHPPRHFSWFGRPESTLPPAWRSSAPPSLVRQCLETGVRNRLYTHFYGQGRATPHLGELAGAVPSDPPDLLRALCEANSGSGQVQGRWRVAAAQGDRLLLTRGGLTVSARFGDLADPWPEAPAPGQEVRLRTPPDRLKIATGYYTALGNQEGTGGPLIRLYWNLTPEGAVPLMRSATAMLNRIGAPFQLKLLAEAALYRRCDAGVLYLPLDWYPALAQLLPELYAAVRCHLKPAVPALTRSLAPGLSLAADPGGGQSFGMHRCGLITQALMAAADAGLRTAADRLRAVEAALASSAIRLEAPYLNPGMPDLPAPLLSDGTSAHSPRVSPPPDFLSAAERVGQWLVQRAHWRGDRCTWIGPAGDTGFRSDRPLDASLYDGSAGVALFLAELAGVSPEPQFRHTALGAARQALALAEASLSALPAGLHRGWTGLLLAMARAAAVTGSEELRERARRLLGSALKAGLPAGELDLLAGAAGTVIGLAALAQALPEADLQAAWAPLGARLLQTARRRRTGYSWPSPAHPRQRHLTGYAHGASGIAHALLELYQATGEAGYRQAAQMALRYERGWFDREKGNWPDLRGEPERAPIHGVVRACPTAWCHGAGGIALARLRAWQVLGDPCWQTEALEALQTVQRAAEASLPQEGSDFTLCHGLLGLAEILRTGSELLTLPASASLARRISLTGLLRYGSRVERWPCGTGGQLSPGLMTGLAGIGHACLRQLRPSIPSVLYVGP